MIHYDFAHNCYLTHTTVCKCFGTINTRVVLVNQIVGLVSVWPHTRPEFLFGCDLTNSTTGKVDTNEVKTERKCCKRDYRVKICLDQP